MMPSSMRSLCVCFCAFAVSLAQAADRPVFSLRAVEINGRAIQPKNHVVVRPGDTIVSEVFLSEFSPNGEALRVYQVSVGMDSFWSGRSGAVRPLGFARPRDDIGCQSDEQCPPEWPVCDPDHSNRICLATEHDSALGWWIDTDRTDYPFFGVEDLNAANHMNYILGSLAWHNEDAEADTGQPKYLGTLVLVVSEDACGTFEFSFVGDATFIEAPYATTPIEPTAFESLTVMVPSCYQLQTDPPNGAIDARQPSKPDGSSPAGWNSLTYRYAVEEELVSAEGSEVAVRVVPDDLGVAIAVIIPSDGETSSDGVSSTIEFRRAIPTQHWTCLEDALSGTQSCVASLPGDVNGDGVSSAADILALIDNLNGVGEVSLKIWQCDIDRSGACTSADILREIDLLNGAGAYQSWLGKTLPDLP